MTIVSSSANRRMSYAVCVRGGITAGLEGCGDFIESEGSVFF